MTIDEFKAEVLKLLPEGVELVGVSDLYGFPDGVCVMVGQTRRSVSWRPDAGMQVTPAGAVAALSAWDFWPVQD